ncbi:MAG TPA: hypothetical protein VE089_09365 [Nitrososphaeraceae archaeon]|nr:hypothetical protein [Nitrososphaeraceae archaeon]
MSSIPIQGSTILYLVIVILFLCTSLFIREFICQNGCISAKSTNAYAVESQSNNDRGALTMDLIGNNGSVLSGTQFSIRPDPFSATTREFIVKDDSANDVERISKGVISLINIGKGNHTITPSSPSLAKPEAKISKIVDVKSNSVTTATFVSPDNNQSTGSTSPGFNTIMYSAKFVCGSIIGSEGPLRPGHYDTDISIYNKQKYPLKILWNAVVNNGSTTNAIIETLQPESAKGIICKDLRYLLSSGNDSKDLVEGFLIIKLPLSGNVLSTTSNNAAGQYISQSPNKDQLDLIDVQAFYTANSLDRIAHATIIDKVTFTILHDLSGKIPRALLQKPLDVSIPSELNTVYDEISRIRSFMAEKFNLSNAESNNLELRIERTSVGVENSIDDHAISLSPVKPQGTNDN